MDIQRYTIGKLGAVVGSHEEACARGPGTRGFPAVKTDRKCVARRNSFGEST
ncbi:hypothetical protein SCLCIDRAFT_1207560 [Scleroderma citrinum Foug A]|uniref:Uncharacterized protein n=1 Tax=Scleroderma citrinum Foug A TaxID=1036808 RepID=A0A0C3AZ32_9AGAM|nr:hypothetical protein SCLCIDRAFT_1207560 [Scleroderma citrinum Foug A]